MSTEQSLRRERQKLVLAPPEHWTPGAGSTGKLSLVKVREVEVLAVLQELLNGTGIGNGGRDQQQPGTFLYSCPVDVGASMLRHHAVQVS
jgi:hypothetical protein